MFSFNDNAEYVFEMNCLYIQFIKFDNLVNWLYQVWRESAVYNF